MYIKAGGVYERFAAEMEDFLDRIDKYYDATLDEELGAGSFYYYLGEDRNDRNKELYSLSKFLSHKGLDKEILASLDNAVEALERLVEVDRQLKEDNFNGIYPTKRMDELYMFAYEMVVDTISMADQWSEMTPSTLAYMGLNTLERLI